jgi:hypothetical protein
MEGMFEVDDDRNRKVIPYIKIYAIVDAEALIVSANDRGLLVHLACVNALEKIMVLEALFQRWMCKSIRYLTVLYSFDGVIEEKTPERSGVFLIPRFSRTFERISELVFHPTGVHH